jgi:HNH endonuclease
MEINLTYKEDTIVVLIDPNFEYLFSLYKWYPHKIKERFYIQRTIELPRTGDKKRHRRTVFLHREIMGVLDSKHYIDHVNGNTLDNRLINMRICDARNNTLNSKAKRRHKVGYKGVYFDKRKKQPWYVQLWVRGGVYSKSGFRTRNEAALYYNQLAREHFGEFAYLNEVQQ